MDKPNPSPEIKMGAYVILFAPSFTRLDKYRRDMETAWLESISYGNGTRQIWTH